MPRDAPISIVLADDDDLIRHALSHMLSAVEGFEIVAQAAGEAEAVQAVRRHRPDVIVMDLWMEGRRSLEAIPEIHAASPGTRVVMLTGEVAVGPARQALRAGASGYLLKGADPGQLPRAIRTAAAGDAYVQPELGARLAAEPLNEPATSGLTAREREVLALLAEGQTSAEAAAHLGLSPRTVEAHRARIQQKLGIYGRSALVRYARTIGIVDR